MSGAGDDLAALVARLSALSAEDRARLEGELDALGVPAVGETERAAGGVLVPVRAAGAGVPLFFAVPSFGTLVDLRRLAARLEPGFAIHALVPPEREMALEGAELRRALIGMGVEEVRKVQQTGPYLLGGFCLGGLFALEVARALHGEGLDVLGCILLDTPFPRPAHRRRLARTAELVEHHLRGALSGGFGETARYLIDRLRRVPRFVRLTNDRREWMRVTSAVDLSFQLSVRAFRDYRFESCPVPLSCVAAAGGLVCGAEERRTRAWRGAGTAGVAWRVVPGEHDTLFDDRNLEDVVAALQRARHEALGRAPESRPARRPGAV